jgi:hypothetical protein
MSTLVWDKIDHGRPDRHEIEYREVMPKARQKTRLDLVPPSAIYYMALGMEEGIQPDKYGPWDWRGRGTKLTTSSCIAAVLRHLLSFLDGEDVDPDSANKKPHLAGALARLAILVDCWEGGWLEDDRPAPGPGPRLIGAKP